MFLLLFNYRSFRALCITVNIPGYDVKGKTQPDVFKNIISFYLAAGGTLT